MKFFILFVGSLSLFGLLVSQVKAELHHSEEDSREHNNERCEHKCHNGTKIAVKGECLILNLNINLIYF
jgi:hypothetical protein